jgi:hypothetical protein
MTLNESCSRITPSTVIAAITSTLQEKPEEEPALSLAE